MILDVAQQVHMVARTILGMSRNPLPPLPQTKEHIFLPYYGGPSLLTGRMADTFPWDSIGHT